MMKRIISKATLHLRKIDPLLGKAIEQIGICNFKPDEISTHFEFLCRSIIFQQLSGKAAGTIFQRFKNLYNGESPDPSQLLNSSDEDLRLAGVSRQKLGYLRDLASNFRSDKEISKQESNENITEKLTKIKGIGKWTAQIFLMSKLGRTDILPDSDLGIQKGIKQIYKLEKLPTPKEVLEIGEKWQPYRTIASWYLWKVVDTLK